MTELAALRFPDVTARARHTVLAIPLGATEQHGPHLPLHTDTTIATELARRLATQLPEVLAAPAVPYGASGEHAGFPGTLSIGCEALRLVLLELVRSADRFAGVVLVNGHGGNLEPLRSAVRTLRSEGRDVLAWSPSAPTTDSHAGHTETSALLYLRPQDVSIHAARPGNTTALPQLMDTLRHSGVAAVSPNGVLGDPTTADPIDGRRILDGWTTALVARTRQHFGLAAPVG
ncbi:mycofactocin biosynthesis peptidyl-dipeptidase MftE [Nocardia stercoris]|uniref:Mycofactocin biosynthesis peptidyl-dipeptidase MftE n=1 Tax=Nocardia stercoris TaxID=2483361 RepID=A0A3M2KZ45_9NOCA|nr:mycofactocin biosynthesis peptidyl-dipeptidase MftE [Nocardia stercoris]RMI28835.1 mycofactocin biosynthesis peptidyl-dipeptidase MftE [Nocardia stercoris]